MILIHRRQRLGALAGSFFIFVPPQETSKTVNLAGGISKGDLLGIFIFDEDIIHRDPYHELFAFDSGKFLHPTVLNKSGYLSVICHFTSYVAECMLNLASHLHPHEPFCSIVPNFRHIFQR